MRTQHESIGEVMRAYEKALSEPELSCTYRLSLPVRVGGLYASTRSAGSRGLTMMWRRNISARWTKKFCNGQCAKNHYFGQR